MNKLKVLLPALGLVGGLLSFGCSDEDTANDAGQAGSASTGGSSNEAGSPPVGEAGAAAGASGPEPFTPPADPGKGGFLVTVSGEDLANVGYDFNAASLADGDPPAFVDGWAVHFDHVIVTVANVRLNTDPDRDEGNPQDLGSEVASAAGPWAVDAALGGDIVGKSDSPDERTIAVTSFAKQANGKPFDADSRYAFSYDLVAASTKATLTNLDEEGRALYAEAQTQGYAMIFAGTATYRGAEPEAESVFAKIPKEVKFALGLRNPSSYINCRNTDLMAVGDEFPRGIQASVNKSTVAQITIHTDHGFWDTLNVEGTPLRFDPIAANASTYGTPDETGSVTIDDLIDVDVTGFTTKDGDILPARSLVSDYTASPGQLKYDQNGTSFKKVNSFASYLGYSAASGGHLNADGECEIKNNFTP
jgi:hypothetical protein